MRRTLTALATILLCAHAAADTHYVSKTGSNAPPFTSWATAGDSIKIVVEAASPYDTVRIGPGVFAESSFVLDTGMCLIGSGRDSTTLQDGHADQYVTYMIIAADSTLVSGIYFNGIGGNPWDGAIQFAFGAGGTVRSNRIDGFQRGIYASYIYFYNRSNVVTVEGNIIDSCIYPITAENGYVVIRNNTIRPYFTYAAIDCAAAAPTIEGNVIIANARQSFTTCILLWHCWPFVVRNNVMRTRGTGIAIDNNSSPSYALKWGLIENNTIDNLDKAGIVVTQTKVLVRNNIVTRSGRWRPAIEVTVDSVLFEYNLVWDLGIPPIWDTSLVSDIVYADPMFQDTVDFLLQAFSPAIDAGDPAILDPDGSRSDIGYTGGPGGFTYTYQDLPPAVPHGLAATPTDSQITLLWRFNHEADFNHYDLYRDTLSIASPNPALLVTKLTDSTYTDSSIAAGRTYYYRITATDNQSNTSDLSNEASVIAAGIADDPITPVSFELHPNYPNPFNASTTIRYTLDRPAHLTLSIYNLLGQHIETLIDEPVAAGTHSVAWHAPDQSSGVYFIVLRTDGTSQVQKALLLK